MNVPFKVVPYSVWRSNFVLTILAVWQIGGHSLNMNAKQFSLYGTTLILDREISVSYGSKKLAYEYIKLLFNL